MDKLGDFISNKSTYATALGIYALTPLAMLPTLFKIDAPYGRFSGKFIINCSYSGKWSWFIMEVISPITFIITFLVVKKKSSSSTPSSSYQLILTSCWLVHYINRSMIYPIRTHSMAPIHILASTSAVFFNLLNGYTNAYWIGIGHDNDIVGTRFSLGILIWSIGFLSNIYHDTLLFKLRMNNNNNKDDNDKKKKYFIPKGGLFDYVSCPNYFSETIEWTGFAMAAWPSTPALVFVMATMANLFPRAWRTHLWYKKEFKDYYLLNRKAVVPFIF